jgi:RNA polymerase sigma factor (sigma-70 family)
MPNRHLLIGWRERWNRSLIQFLRRRSRRAEVEDLAQETYLRLLRARDLHDVRNPQAYRFTVASHVLAEWRKTQDVDVVDAADEEWLIDEATPQVQLEALLSQERLDQALQEMTPVMRAVVLLRLRDERSNKEIAELLGLTLRQVRRYLERGYKRLHTVLED